MASRPRHPGLDSGSIPATPMDAETSSTSSFRRGDGGCRVCNRCAMGSACASMRVGRHPEQYARVGIGSPACPVRCGNRVRSSCRRAGDRDPDPRIAQRRPGKSKAGHARVGALVLDDICSDRPPHLGISSCDVPSDPFSSRGAVPAGQDLPGARSNQEWSSSTSFGDDGIISV